MEPIVGFEPTRGCESREFTKLVLSTKLRHIGVTKMVAESGIEPRGAAL